MNTARSPAPLCHPSQIFVHPSVSPVTPPVPRAPFSAPPPTTTTTFRGEVPQPVGPDCWSGWKDVERCPHYTHLLLLECNTTQHGMALHNIVSPFTQRLSCFWIRTYLLSVTLSRNLQYVCLCTLLFTICTLHSMFTSIEPPGHWQQFTHYIQGLNNVNLLFATVFWSSS